ncbi:DUF2273 domain-containing protein [Alicyclobacillus curvatus]|jgi:uncharacterized membrane protein|nr:DUF2273 domain-containing protein [Alicyclobacillus curvatus]
MWTFVRAISVGLLNLKRRWQGLIAGVVLWLAWMIFGFWSTLLLLVLMAVGFFVGRILEEKRDWKHTVEKLLADRYSDHS